MDKHLTKYHLNEPLQSANHSAVTALLTVTTDILLALDERKCVFLVLLNLLTIMNFWQGWRMNVPNWRGAKKDKIILTGQTSGHLYQ